VADVYAWRGEKDEAFKWLERAYRQHDAGVTFVVYDQFLNSLRRDPRYKALMHKLKLPEA
jgi:serine/threonine-protein kinase